MITNKITTKEMRTAIMESTSPIIANTCFERARRPSKERTIPTIGIMIPKNGNQLVKILMMPSTKPAIANAEPGSDGV